jgi:hypothetical protein
MGKKDNQSKDEETVDQVTDLRAFNVVFAWGALYRM